MQLHLPGLKKLNLKASYQNHSMESNHEATKVSILISKSGSDSKVM